MVGELYLEQLSNDDLVFLVQAAGVGGRQPERVAALLRDEPALIERLLGRPEVFDRLFGSCEGDPLLRASPFLVFAVVVHRATEELLRARFIHEWIGPKRRVPVFDVAELQRLAGDPALRFYLVDLLTSYTRVVSGSVWVRTPRGAGRRKFSELDPLRLASMLEFASDQERPLIYRRLGDLAMFLTGVFPDHAGRRALRPLELASLLRAAGMAGPEIAEWTLRGTEGGLDDPFGTIGVFEQLGQRWYRLAAGEAPVTGMRRVLMDVAEHFRPARRVLNFIADRYIHRYRPHWFALPAG